MVTTGDDLACALHYLAPGATSYSAVDVVRTIMSGASHVETMPASLPLAVAPEPTLEIAGD